MSESKIDAYARITGYPEVVNYQLTPDDAVLDIGGYLGDWTAALEDTSSRIFVFEPVRKFYDVIKLRFEKNPNITVLNVALSDHTGHAAMVVTEDSSYIANVGLEIRTLDIVDFFKEYVIEKVTLASVNIEGHEFTLIPRIIESGLINRIENLQIQFHSKFLARETILNAVEFRDSIRAKLALTHIETYCYPFVWESWRKK